MFLSRERNGDRSVAETNIDRYGGTKPIKSCPFVGEKACKLILEKYLF